jgi:hypothetical protein
MPRRAKGGNRQRIEAALPADLRDALHELRALLNISDWLASPLGPVFSAAAVVEMSVSLTRSGTAPHTALERSCAFLDLAPDTVRSWLRRWPRDSRGVHSAHTVGRGTAVSLIQDVVDARHTERDAA